MKSIFTVVLVFAFVTTFSQATTEVEYNYIKKGIAYTEEKGLDVKAGYTLVDLPRQSFLVKSASVIFKKLVRNKDNSVAGFFIKIIDRQESYGTQSVYYYCMPAPNSMSTKSFGWPNFYNEIDNMPVSVRDNIIYLFAYNASFNLTVKP